MAEFIEKQKLIDWITATLDNQENWMYLTDKTQGSIHPDIKWFDKGYKMALRDIYDEIKNDNIE